MHIGYAIYVSKLDPSVRQYLKRKLDWNTGGVDRDLSEIAGHIPDWEAKLAAKMGLNNVAIHDIIAQNSKSEALQR